MYSAIIEGITVASRNRYVVIGQVRGLVSEHRTLSGAERSLARDRRCCRLVGGYSDAAIFDMERVAWIEEQSHD